MIHQGLLGYLMKDGGQWDDRFLKFDALFNPCDTSNWSFLSSKDQTLSVVHVYNSIVWVTVCLLSTILDVEPSSGVKQKTWRSNHLKEASIFTEAGGREVWQLPAPHACSEAGQSGGSEFTCIKVPVNSWAGGTMRIFHWLEGIVTLAKDAQEVLISSVLLPSKSCNYHKADLLGKGWLVLWVWTVIHNYSNKAASRTGAG